MRSFSDDDADDSRVSPFAGSTDRFVLGPESYPSVQVKIYSLSRVSVSVCLCPFCLCLSVSLSLSLAL